MKYKRAIFSALAVVLALVLASIWYFNRHPILVLDPKGVVADRQRNLIVFSLLVMLIVVLPVYFMAVLIAWRYREGNKKARYSPDLEGNRAAEAAWWLIPSAIIAVLAVIAWNSSHTLDPYRPLSGTKAMTIQVVALNWKWLFIYPEQNVASVNYVRMPVNQPVDFEITSDAPMNSFWIPQLGGQIYAMAGMDSHLHLQADQPGSYAGSSANISGRGFADMNFTAQATSENAFNQWIGTLKQFNNPLSTSSFNELARPSQDNPVSFYSSTQSDLYGNLLAKFTVPGMMGYLR